MEREEVRGMGEKINTFEEERKLLHEQFKLLAEKSADCSAEELIKISQQMTAIHSVLYNSCC